MSLSNSQRRYLRGLGHHLKPVVMLGGKGLTDAVVKEIDRALLDHELIKVRITAEDRDSKKALIGELQTRCGAELVQAIGHIVCLYRRHPKQPQLALPA
jgi:RNA-binding protein